MVDRESQISAEELLAQQQQRFDIHVMAFADRSPAAAEALARAFALDAATSARLLSEAPIVVKRDASPEVADALLDVLARLGAQVVLLPSAARKLESEPREAQPPSARADASAWGGLDLELPAPPRSIAPRPPATAAQADFLVSLQPPPAAERDDLEFDLGAGEAGGTGEGRSGDLSAQSEGVQESGAAASSPPDDYVAGASIPSPSSAPLSLPRSPPPPLDHTSHGPESALPDLGLGDVPPLPPLPPLHSLTAEPAPRAASRVAPPPPRAPHAAGPMSLPGAPPLPDLVPPRAPAPAPGVAPGRTATGSRPRLPVPPPRSPAPPASITLPRGRPLPEPASPRALPAAQHARGADDRSVAGGQRWVDAPGAHLPSPALAVARERRRAGAHDPPRQRRDPALEPPPMTRTSLSPRLPQLELPGPNAQAAAGSSAARSPSPRPADPALAAKSAKELPARASAPAPRRSRAMAVLELAGAVLVLYLGLRLDNTVLHGNASPLSIAVHGLAFYALGAGLAGLRP